MTNVYRLSIVFSGYTNTFEITSPIGFAPNVSSCAIDTLRLPRSAVFEAVILTRVVLSQMCFAYTLLGDFIILTIR